MSFINDIAFDERVDELEVEGDLRVGGDILLHGEFPKMDQQIATVTNTLNSSISLKANQSDLDVVIVTLNMKADHEEVIASLSLKADQSELDSALSSVDRRIDGVDGLLGTKANQSALDTLDTRASVLEADLTSNASRVSVLETDLSDTGSRVSVLEEDMASNIDILHGNVETLSGNIEMLHGNVEMLTSNIDILHGNVETLTSNIEILHGNVETLTSNIDILHGNVETLTSNIDILHGNVETLENNIEILHGNVETLTDDLASNAARIDTLDSTVSSQGNTLSSHGNRLDTLEDDVDTLETDVQYIQDNYATDTDLTTAVASEAAATVAAIAAPSALLVPKPTDWATRTPAGTLPQYVDSKIGSSSVIVFRPVDWISYPELDSEGNPVIPVHTTLRSYTDTKIENGVDSGIDTFRDGGSSYLRLRNTTGGTLLQFLRSPKDQFGSTIFGSAPASDWKLETNSNYGLDMVRKATPVLGRYDNEKVVEFKDDGDVNIVKGGGLKVNGVQVVVTTDLADLIEVVNENIRRTELQQEKARIENTELLGQTRAERMRASTNPLYQAQLSPGRQGNLNLFNAGLTDFSELDPLTLQSD